MLNKFSGMDPQKNFSSNKKITNATNTSRTQVGFDNSRFLGAEQEERFRELESRGIWAEKRFSINWEGDHRLIAQQLEMRKLGTLINPH